MASSRLPRYFLPFPDGCRIPARSCGPLGLFDQGDPNVTSLLGDTPGPLGWGDWGDPALRTLPYAAAARMCAPAGGAPQAPAVHPDGDSAHRKPAGEIEMSEDGLKLLRAVEQLSLKPYDDQTGKETDKWVKGATIGYGHLLAQAEWDSYKDGITETDAIKLFDKDLLPFVKTVREAISVPLAQNEFDALVILAFNIGPAFKSSSVAKLVNDPKAVTSYASLEEAWKAWNKSQGKVMKGLENRRQCEWNIYSKGKYERW
ncbi:MAG: lysozyme [Rhodocyclaceae bacterium]|nr:lysozyme [Rhodocyclaceae bacterium]MBX3670163.1 lysozyme [Rhodocyclaceae bacterium]